MRTKLKKIAIGLFVMLFLVCAGVPTLLWSLGGGVPTIAVDYEAKLNERAAAVPEGERAWLIYRDLTAHLESLEELDGLALHEDFADDSPQMVQVRAFVEGSAALVASARLAGTRAGLGYITSRRNEASYLEAQGKPFDHLDPEDESPRWLLGVELPYLGDARTLARLLTADIRVALADGQGDRVVRDLEAMLGVSRQAGEHDLLICQLVELAIRGLAFGEIERVLRSKPEVLSDADLAAVSGLLDELDEGGQYVASYEIERLLLHDTIQRAYTDDGNGNGRILIDALGIFDQTSPPDMVDKIRLGVSKRIGTGVVRFFSIDRAQITEVVDELYDRAEHFAKRPPTPWPGPPQSDLLKRAYDAEEFPRLDYGMRLLSMLVPAFGKVAANTDDLNAKKDAVRVAVAAERYRRERGQWPSRVQDLVPEYLTSAPLDPFGSGPLKTAVDSSGLVVYSIGADRDDDGGRHGMLAKRWVAPSEVGSISNGDDAEGDWVLFPEPERR